MSKRFWNWVRDEAVPEMRTLRLDGAIAEESWLNDEVTPAAFKDELMSGSGPITVWINSPGGDCIAAAQIYNMLMDYPSDVVVKIDGVAASAASVIAMAGTTVMMSPTSLLMIHNPMTAAMGDTEDMRKAIQLLEEVKESIINSYEIKTGLSRARLSHLMDNETWMNAKKALEFGFCDEIMFGKDKDSDEDEEDSDEDQPDEDDDGASNPDENASEKGKSDEEKRKNEKKINMLSAYTFSARVNERRLLNKLVDFSHASKTVANVSVENSMAENPVAQSPVVENPVVENPVVEKRVPVADLEKRLSLLRY